MKKFNLILLSAGISKRMGSPKAFLKFNENFSFIHKIISEYEKIDSIRLYVVVSSEIMEQYKQKKLKFLENCNIILNNEPEKGRFHSIVLASNAMDIIRPSFIQNIDNPFICIEDLTILISSYTKGSYLKPKVNNHHVHPILLSREIVQNIKNSTDFKGSLNEFLNDYSSISIPVKNEKLILNINTPEDYHKYFKNPKSTSVV